MSERSILHRVIRHISQFRRSKGQRLLDVCYGPQAVALRTQCIALMLDRKVSGSDKAVQWGNFRKAMLEAVGVEQGVSCIATEDAEFESRANTILAADPVEGGVV